ncbi:MAG: hypothetical protein IH987_09790, partial [Planctomycetes bacterium]|nr:hypothetical protein [Planctomycetota bacterium]
TLTDALDSGRWEKVEYRLLNDTEHWTFGGNNVAQPDPERYSYWPINEAQAHLNCDFFHMLTFVDPQNPPTGAIDFDEFELAYCNYSLLVPSNDGKLIGSPNSPDDPATLTDGWRHGEGRMWRSAEQPVAPLEFDYAFKDMVTIHTVQLHQNPRWPAKEVEVLVSSDGKSYTPIVKTTLPEKGTPSANFAFSLNTGLSAQAKYLKVQVVSGYRRSHWGLGEVEVFGSGATLLPDDDLYFVNTDIKNLEGGKTYHYRLVAVNRAGTRHGEDRKFTVPADRKPRVKTGAASRITTTTAKIEGRLNPLGLRSHFHFEYGLDHNYGSKTPIGYGGLQITPRTGFATLTDLRPGTMYHYRLVASNREEISYGNDATLTTAAR